MRLPTYAETNNFLYTVICYPKLDGETSIEVEVLARNKKEAKCKAEKLTESKESYVKSIREII